MAIPCTKEFRALERAKRKSDAAWAKVDNAELGVNVVGAGATATCTSALTDPSKAFNCATLGLGFFGGLIAFNSLLDDANQADLDALDTANDFVDCVGNHKEFFGEDFYKSLKY